MLLVEPLFGNAVHVWLQPIPAVLSSHLFLYITPEEKDYLAAMRNEHRQKEWLAARALLRACLAHYTGVDALMLAFEKTPAGKPVLINPKSALAFNVSHGPRWVACAVSLAQAVGVDVDCERRKNRIDEIAEKYFHSQEKKALALISDTALRSREFFRCWTLKEAFIKAQGNTIAGTALHEIAFASSAAGKQTALFSLPSAGWHFMHGRFDDDHHLALAIEQSDCDTDAEIIEPAYRFLQWEPASNALQSVAMHES